MAGFLSLCSGVPHSCFSLGCRKLEWRWAWRQTLMRRYLSPLMQAVHVGAWFCSFELCLPWWSSSARAAVRVRKRKLSRGIVTPHSLYLIKHNLHPLVLLWASTGRLPSLDLPLPGVVRFGFAGHPIFHWLAGHVLSERITTFGQKRRVSVFAITITEISLTEISTDNHFYYNLWIDPGLKRYGSRSTHLSQTSLMAASLSVARLTDLVSQSSNRSSLE